MAANTKGCTMIGQGYPRGSCLVETSDGEQRLACKVTLRNNPDSGHERLIRSLLLSRPEDYLSIYQSGCNHTLAQKTISPFIRVAAIILASSVIHMSSARLSLENGCPLMISHR
ncbi:MAG: hypothetical protein ACXACT_05095 [Candidatus Thorarchaeota archaeon]